MNRHQKTFLILAGLILCIGLILALVFYCDRDMDSPERVVSSIPLTLEPEMTYEVITSYPHDPSAFTQGLVYWEGYFYESTGLYGESSLRKVAIETGEVLQKTDLPQAYFGEGLTLWQDQLIQLTWREGTGFIYNLEYFTLIEDFTYPTEGWGLTHDGTHLIMSDGSPTLFYLDPETFQVVNRVNVFYQGQNISRINELEYIRGEIFANIWQTDDIIRIDPHTGEVMGWIDLGGLLPNAERTPATDVLNGIAYDPENDRLFITGKRWPKVYEVRLLPIEPGE
jgi:glutamine cyclotransferase